MNHRRRHHGQPGSAVLYVILLSPVLMLTIAFAVEVGALQLKKERLRSAVDEAVVVASSAASSGASSAQLDPAAATVTVRTAIADNLQPLSEMLAEPPGQIAQSAEVHIITTVPVADPLDPTQVLRVPTIEARVQARVPTGLLTAAGLPPSELLTLTAGAQLRLNGT